MKGLPPGERASWSDILSEDPALGMLRRRLRSAEPGWAGFKEESIAAAERLGVDAEEATQTA